MGRHDFSRVAEGTKSWASVLRFLRGGGCGLTQNNINMDEQVILIAGLPGSGKTTHLCQMLRDHWLVFDDYKRQAFGNSSKFRKSQKFQSLVSALRDGVRCAVADIDFCKTESRQEAESALREEVPGVPIGWLFFESDPTACEANIRVRARDCLPRELDLLRELFAVYRIPQDATVFAVRRNTDRRAAN